MDISQIYHNKIVVKSTPFKTEVLTYILTFYIVGDSEITNLVLRGSEIRSEGVRYFWEIGYAGGGFAFDVNIFSICVPTC